MGRFMDQAVDQAGREFGSRFWRWFVAGRILRGAAPALAVIVVALVALAGYRWWSPDWAGLGGGARDGLSALGSGLSWLGLALLGAGAAAVVFGLAVLVARNWWRWPMVRPLWMDSARAMAGAATALCLVVGLGAVFMIWGG